MSDSDADFSLSNDPTNTRFKKARRGHGNEAKKVHARLKGFDYEQCETWKAISNHFSSGITHSELKSIAVFLCSKISGLKLDRDASRDNRVLIKWFDENWIKIEPVINKIDIHDDNFRSIKSIQNE